VIIKKKNNYSFFSISKKIFNKIIFFLGLISFFFLTLITLYYFTSGMYERFKPITLIKKIDEVILNKYFGFSIYQIDDYAKLKLYSIKYIFFSNKLENVNIEIDQENLYKLELQRQEQLNQKKNILNIFSNAKLNFNNEKYNIKIRVKGDRVLHWYDKTQTSYKIDLKGENRLWGLEEFSIQKPITRNYIYEYIFHKYLEYQNLISLKYFFINLSINDSKRGIYAVEEGFSKELIERNKKRNGPIFSINETKNIRYPDVEYELYSEKYWRENHPNLVNQALFSLNQLKNNQIDLNLVFDLDKWATYFAIIDLTGTFHGVIPKSVKLFYNPVTAKFEPIGFDGHYNSNLFNNFLILDFMDDSNKNCDYICSDREWILKFLKNNEFVELYIKKLEEISSINSIKNFYKINLDMINFFNEQFLSESSKTDKVLYKGIGIYQFNENYLFNRSEYIKNRINEFNKKKILNIKSKKNFGKDLTKEANIIFHEGKYFLRNDMEINQRYFLPSGKILIIEKGVKIKFNKDVSIFSEGSIYMNGTDKEPIIIYSDKKFGSLVFMDNIYNINNVIFQNLSYPKERDRILYGGINIINSNLEIINTKIFSSNSEDAINIISSNSFIKNLELKDIKSDAIDIDFGNLKFEAITCEQINNDCLDISGAEINGKFISGKYIKDKGLSFGEKSLGNIDNIYFENSRLGVAVKDGSNLKIYDYKFLNNEYDVAVFNKKKEYSGSSLYLDSTANKDNLNYLIGFNNNIIKEKEPLFKKVSNSYINNLFY